VFSLLIVKLFKLRKVKDGRTVSPDGLGKYEGLLNPEGFGRKNCQAPRQRRDPSGERLFNPLGLGFSFAEHVLAGGTEDLEFILSKIDKATYQKSEFIS
jgi:hypothetical protein